MKRFVAATLLSALALSACAPVSTGPDGTRTVNRAYRIPAGAEADIQFRMLDAMNALRSAGGAAPLQLNAQLNAAAATHSRDMSVQNRPWHFGSDGSSPLDRVRRVGYTGQLMGEAISETFETELQTLGAWMEDPATRDVVMDAKSRDMGFSYFQESSGKIWWTLVTGAPSFRPAATSFPTAATSNTNGFDLSRLDAAIGN